ncbi:hypothetical protein ACJJTC_011346 [Scirpophaga incertulas]
MLLSCTLTNVFAFSLDAIALSELLPVSSWKWAVLLNVNESSTIEESLKPSDPMSLTDSSHARIIGDQDASLEDYPNNNKNYILTSGHCAQNVIPNDVLFRDGSSLHDNGTIIPIAEIIYSHVQYNNQSYYKNVVMMRRVSSNKFTDPMLSLSLAALGRPLQPRSIIMVRSWGSTEQGGPICKRLLDVDVPAVRRFMIAFGSIYTDNKFCVENFCSRISACHIIFITKGSAQLKLSTKISSIITLGLVKETEQNVTTK